MSLCIIATGCCYVSYPSCSFCLMLYRRPPKSHRIGSIPNSTPYEHISSTLAHSRTLQSACYTSTFYSGFFNIQMIGNEWYAVYLADFLTAQCKIDRATSNGDVVLISVLVKCLEIILNGRSPSNPA